MRERGGVICGQMQVRRNASAFALWCAEFLVLCVQLHSLGPLSWPGSPCERRGMGVQLTGRVLMCLRGGGAVGAGSGESASEASEAGTSRRGRGKEGLARRRLLSQEETLPNTGVQAQGVEQEYRSQAPVEGRASNVINDAAAGAVGIEDATRAMEGQTNARLRARHLRAGKSGGQQGRAAGTPKHVSKGRVSRGSSVPKEEAAGAPTRTLRERSGAVNYEEDSESVSEKGWFPGHSDMCDGQDPAGGRERADVDAKSSANVRRAAAGQGHGRARRPKSLAEKAANPLGQELSESANDNEALQLREREEAREERRKRRLEDEAEDGSADAAYRASRRKLIRDHWGESPEPPPLPRREYTFEEDLAVFRDAERQLRAACEAGDVAEAERLLARGAVMEEWDDCTEDTVLTLMRAMRRDAETRSEATALRVESSSEHDGLLEDILRDLNLTESQPAVVSRADGHSRAVSAKQRPEEHELARLAEMGDEGEGDEQRAPVGAPESVRSGAADDGVDDDDEAQAEMFAWREGGRWGGGMWGALPLPADEDVSLEGELFLDCQVTGTMRGELVGNERGYRKYQRACQEFFAAEFPEHRAFRLTGDTDKVGAFTPGEEDCEGLSESEERLWRDVPALHGWIDPMGRRMHKIEMAVMRNATHTLSREEQEAIIVSQPPCVALQDDMSESLDSHDTKDLLVIPKKTTEITRLDIDPFDKLQSKLSTNIGRKEFDFIDALGGFERASAQIGVRGTDQTYNQRRARFMNSKKGSYK